MKFTPELLAFLGLAVSDVAAQAITPAPVCPGGPCSSAVAAVPECASSCISSAAETAASCTIGDFECQCVSSAVIQNAAVGCVLGACADPIGVINAVGTVCSCVGSNPGTYCGSPSTSEPPTSEPTTAPTSEPTTEPTSEPTSEPPSSSPTSYPESSPPPTSTETTPTSSCIAVTKDCGPVATSAVPECAQACFSSYAPSVGCGVNDFACQCQPTAQASLSSLLVPCVATACPAAQLPSVIAGASSVCACATAAPGQGECGGGGSGTTSKPPPTSSPYPTTSKGGDDGDHSSSTCKSATKADCGPVASSAVPSCAQACFSKYAPSVGCDVMDYGCQCQPTAQASLSQLLVPCVATACEAAQLPSVIAGASSVCACATAPPSGGDCGGNGGGNGGSPTPTPTTTPCPTNPPNNGGGGHGGSGGSGGESTTCVEVTIAAPIGGGSGNAACAPLASSIEACAQPCFSSAVPKVGCSIDDYTCQCQADHQASLSQILVPCVATACEAAVLPSIIAEASAVCACAATAGSGGAGPKPITTTTCYPIGGGGVTTKPTGGNGGGNGGSNGGGNGGSGATKTGASTPATVPTAGANAKFEMGVVGTVFGAAWLAAIAL